MRGSDSVSVHTDYYNVRLESGEVVAMSREEMSELVRKTIRRARGSSSSSSDHFSMASAIPPPPPPPGLPPTSPTKRRRSPRKPPDEVTRVSVDDRNPSEDDRQYTYELRGDFHGSNTQDTHEPQPHHASSGSYTVTTEREGPQQLSQGELRRLVRSSILQARQQQTRSTGGGSRRGTPTAPHRGASPTEHRNGGGDATKDTHTDRGKQDRYSDAVSVATEPSQLTEPPSLRRISDEMRGGSGASPTRRCDEDGAGGHYLDSEVDAHEDVLRNARRLLSTMADDFTDPVEARRSAKLSPIVDDETVSSDMYERNEPQVFTFHETDIAEEASPKTKTGDSPGKQTFAAAIQTQPNVISHSRLTEFENEFYESIKASQMDSDIFGNEYIGDEFQVLMDSHPRKPDPAAFHIDSPTSPSKRYSLNKKPSIGSSIGSNTPRFPPDTRSSFTLRGKERISQYNRRNQAKKTGNRSQKTAMDAAFPSRTKSEKFAISDFRSDNQEEPFESGDRPFSGPEIENIVHISMDKAQQLALIEVQEMLQDFKRHKNMIGIKTEDGYKVVTQTEIAGLVKESMHKARQVAQQEIADVIRESMQQARESAQTEIRELVLESMRRARESALKEMSAIVKKTLREAKADDSTVVSASAFTLNSVPTIYPHPHDGLSSLLSAKASQTEEIAMKNESADKIPENSSIPDTSSGSVFEGVHLDDEKKEKSVGQADNQVEGITSTKKDAVFVRLGESEFKVEHESCEKDALECEDSISEGSLQQQASNTEDCQRNDESGTFFCGVLPRAPDEQSDGEASSIQSRPRQQEGRLSNDLEDILSENGQQRKRIEVSESKRVTKVTKASVASNSDKKSKRKYRYRDNLAPLSPSGLSHVSLSLSEYPPTKPEDHESRSSKFSGRSARQKRDHDAVKKANGSESVVVTDEILTQIANLKGSTVTQAELNILFALAQDDSTSSTSRDSNLAMGLETKERDEQPDVRESKFCMNFMDLLSMDDGGDAYKDGSLSMTSSYGPHREREWLGASTAQSNINDTFSGTDQESNEESTFSETSEDESQSRRS